jgi:spore germination protein KC
MAADRTDDGLSLSVLESDIAHSAEEEESEGEILTVTGGSMAILEKKLQTKLAKTVYWGQVNVVLIGSECAERDMSEVLDYVFGNHEFNLSSYLFITDGNARDFLEATREAGHSIQDYVKNNMTRQEVTGRRGKSTLLKHLSDRDDIEYSASVIPILSLSGLKRKDAAAMAADTAEEAEEENPIGNARVEQSEKKKNENVSIGIRSYAVIKDSKMIGVLDGAEYLGYNLLTGVIKKDFLEIPYGAETVSVGVENMRSRVIPRYDNGFYFDVRIRADASPAEANKDIDEKGLEEIGRAVEKKITENAESCIKAMKDGGEDFLQWYKLARARFPKKFREGDYGGGLPEMRVNVRAEVNIGY